MYVVPQYVLEPDYLPRDGVGPPDLEQRLDVLIEGLGAPSALAIFPPQQRDRV